MRTARLFLIASVLASAACSTQRNVDDTDGTWVGTITTEGNVTTVINESGSVWGGMAKLVEEASIGVQAGADEYLLGRVRSIAATSERIFVLDAQVPIVRAYDHDGQHVADIGREGQGPGEFEQPLDIGVGVDGSLFVRQPGRVNVFGPRGESVDTWPMDASSYSASGMVVDAQGEVFVPEPLDRGPIITEWKYGNADLWAGRSGGRSDSSARVRARGPTS